MPEIPAPIGVLGGTFDPIHYGHLRLAEEAADRCGLARVLLIPAAVPNLRSAPRTPAQHRLAMAQLAATGNARLAVDARELERTGTSFTVDTLSALRAELGAAQPLCLILGADAFLRLPAWDRWQQLFELAHIVVAARPGYDVAQGTASSPELAPQWRSRSGAGSGDLAKHAHGRIMVIDNPLLEIAATAIRERILRGASVRYLLPAQVLDYIGAHHLYGAQ